jgi:ABC-2 type transport system ATP-binding protein
MLALIQDLPARRGCAIVLSTHLLPDVERVCDRAVIMHRGAVRFTGTIEALRADRSTANQLNVEVKADAARFAEVLTTAGATCKPISPIALEVELPDGATTQLVFRAARDAGIQVRGLSLRRETIEAAFLRVIGTA